ncbi:MAG: hypothetical protein COT85_00180 [Chlamydiae bacterium CG10_big_fil_rev_8_21_14_0_10_42_34]|nr:MAG: hypothetical protein COT85_00180 [Chlamydiae bacterium CG10_big_fil_rev_8_21_14_0_10_42_34]
MFLFNRLSAAGCVVAGSALTSLSPFFIEFSGIEAVASSFYRLGIGGAALFLFVLLSKKQLPKKKTVGLCFLASILISMDLVMWNQSILYVGPGLATVLGNLEIVFLVIIGAVFFRERLPLKFLIMCCLIAIGIYALITPYLIDFKVQNLVGIAVGISSSLVYSVYLLLIKTVGRENSEISILSILSVIFLFGASLLGSYILISPSLTFAIPTWQGVACVVSNGLTCQVFGWFLISKGLKDVKLSLSGLLMLTQPSLVFIFDCFFLGRNTEWIQIFGCILLLLAVYGASQKRSEEPAVA